MSERRYHRLSLTLLFAFSDVVCSARSAHRLFFSQNVEETLTRHAFRRIGQVLTPHKLSQLVAVLLLTQLPCQQFGSTSAIPKQYAICTAALLRRGSPCQKECQLFGPDIDATSVTPKRFATRKVV